MKNMFRSHGNNFLLSDRKEIYLQFSAASQRFTISKQHTSKIVFITKLRANPFCLHGDMTEVILPFPY